MLYQLSYFRKPLTWCPEQDSNLHASRHTHLKRARLPIPPFLHLGIHQLFAYIAVENLPSRRLFAACGYKESAVLKEWAHTFGGGYTDVLVVQKLNLS